MYSSLNACSSIIITNEYTPECQDKSRSAIREVDVGQQQENMQKTKSKRELKKVEAEPGPSGAGRCPLPCQVRAFLTTIYGHLPLHFDVRQPISRPPRRFSEFLSTHSINKIPRVLWSGLQVRLGLVINSKVHYRGREVDFFL